MNSKHFLLALSLFSASALAQSPSVECLLRGDCFRGEDVMNHLKALQAVAEKGSGNRAAGSLGHELSANYIAQKLLAAGFIVKLEPFDFMKFEKISAKFLKASVVFEEGKDFNLMSYSGSGTATAQVSAVDLQMGEGNTSTSGCETADFSSFPKGNIALIQRGSCSFGQKVANAQAAGAAGVVIFNQGNTPDRSGLLVGTLPEGTSIKIPAIAISYSFAETLLSEEGLELTVEAETFVDQKVSFNVIAETKGGNPDNVVMIGAHLDSVGEGPGINDNGSGSAGILSVALKMKDLPVVNKVRFGWFSAEELGLIGSTKYVAALTQAEKDKIALFINVDMIGSPNYMIGVYDGDGSRFGQKGPEGSAAIENLFHSFYGTKNVRSVETELNGRSDYAAFSAAGIAVGGIFTGAEGKKTEDEAVLFGGAKDEAYDACYHKACDDLANISTEALELNTNAIAYLAQSFANSAETVRGSNKLKGLARLKNRVVFPKHLHCNGDEHAE